MGKVYVLTGLACNGKTTIAQQFRDRFIVVSEPVRYLESHDLPLEVRQRIYLSVALAQWDAIVQIPANILMDRCFVDVLAFTVALTSSSVEVPRRIPERVEFLYIEPPPRDILEICFMDPVRRATLPKDRYHEIESRFRQAYREIVGSKMKVFPHPATSDEVIRYLKESIYT